MKARRVSLMLSLPLALGLLGCGREDDVTAPAETDRRDVPARPGDDDPLTAPGDEQGIPPVPNETGDPLDRDQEFERGSRTGPQPTNPDQAMPGAND